MVVIEITRHHCTFTTKTPNAFKIIWITSSGSGH